MATDFKATQQAEYYRAFLEKNVRPDGRELGEIRPAILNTGYITTAEGSALVKLGHMIVICGIKAEITTPTPEEPHQGFIVPNVELPPLCSASFKQGPPLEKAQAACKFIDNVLINSNCVDRNELCIKEAKMCWVLYCDIICLNYDGNLLGVCTTALLAALRTVQLPSVDVCERTGIPKVDLEKTHLLTIHSHPVATSFSVFDDDIILVDPTREEESLATGLFTIVTMEDEQVCTIYKPGGSSLSKSKLQDCVTRSHVHAKEVQKLIEDTVNTVDR
ncbi:Exosome complex component RRP43 [Lamellibrachia satsuma]|nr:Exosome complex component RRP43 [Lamellibrachia satsuma]